MVIQKWFNNERMLDNWF